MNLKHYDYSPSLQFDEYTFYSQGPKGQIKKSVVYSCINNDPPIYNLAFGDVDKHGEFNDMVNSNNEDRDLVLATVANTIHDFSDKYGNNLIFAMGSTPARTRLYQIGIAALLNEILPHFNLWGYKNNNWGQFECNINYDAFLVKRKK